MVERHNESEVTNARLLGATRFFAFLVDVKELATHRYDSQPKDPERATSIAEDEIGQRE